LIGFAFDLVRVAIILVRLSTDGIDKTDFFFSSIILFNLLFDFGGGGFIVEQVDEVDLKYLVLNFILKYSQIFTCLNLYSLTKPVSK